MQKMMMRSCHSMLSNRFWSQFLSDSKIEQQYLACADVVEVISCSAANSVMCGRISSFWIVMFEVGVECVNVRKVLFGCVFTAKQKWNHNWWMFHLSLRKEMIFSDPCRKLKQNLCQKNRAHNPIIWGDQKCGRTNIHHRWARRTALPPIWICRTKPDNIISITEVLTKLLRNNPFRESVAIRSI